MSNIGHPRMIRTAQAIRRAAAQQASLGARPIRQASVLNAAPLQAELLDTRMILDDEDLLLVESVRVFDLSFGFQEGDTLLVQQQPNDEFLVVGVLTDTDISPVTLGSKPPTAAEDIEYRDAENRLVTPSSKIVGKWPAYDADGGLIGYLPIYEVL